MYHDVVLLREATAWFDVAHIQAYLNNGHRVLYLDRSLQTKSRLAPNAACCKVCDRTLQHPYFFCSLRCKLFPNLAANRDSEEAAAAETCPNTPQSSVGSAAPSSPACLLLPPANKRAAVMNAASERLLAPAAQQLAVLRRVPPLVIPKKSAGAVSSKPAVCISLAKKSDARVPTRAPPSSPTASQLDSEIRKNKRKGRPVHSPAAGPKTFSLLRQTLQPLLL
jgi:hypothetical protein